MIGRIIVWGSSMKADLEIRSRSKIAKISG